MNPSPSPSSSSSSSRPHLPVGWHIPQALLAVWFRQHHLDLPRQTLVLQHICYRFHHSKTTTPTTSTVYSQSLTNFLLKRDGLTRPFYLFFLPDPRHNTAKMIQHGPHSSLHLSLFAYFLPFLLFAARYAGKIPLPYTVFLQAVPFLTILTFLSASAGYLHDYLLRIFVKPVMVATEVFMPATLFVSAVLAFVGRFM